MALFGVQCSRYPEYGILRNFLTTVTVTVTTGAFALAVAFAFMHYLITNNLLLGIGGNLFGQFLPSHELVMAVDDGDVVTVNVGSKEEASHGGDGLRLGLLLLPRHERNGDLLACAIPVPPNLVSPLRWRESWPH